MTQQLTKKQTNYRTNPKKHLQDTENTAITENSKFPGWKSSLEAKLRAFLNDYDQRYYRINEQYPIGHMERPETMRIHQKSAIEKLEGILRGI